jgi:hypothetical protein
MKKILIISGIAAITLFAADRNFDGYSYFATGVQHFEYTEKFIYTFNSAYIGKNGKTYPASSNVAVKSKLNVTNPVYLSGSLIKFNNNWDLSMDFASTLKPNETTEEWLDRGDDSTIVSNYATIMSNSMKFLMHYKITNLHRITFGFNYILNTFKRYNNPDTNGATQYLVEETTSTLVLNLGYWFESNTAALDGLRIKFNIEGGLPVYENVTNTAAPSLTFDKTSGYNLSTGLTVGYTLFRGLEIDLFTNYSYMYRDGETQHKDGKTIIWPTNITQSLDGGLQVTWKFD